MRCFGLAFTCALCAVCRSLGFFFFCCGLFGAVLLDQSGSMRGPRMTAAKQALQLCLRAVPAGSRLNVVGFGSRPQQMWASARPYSNQSLYAATKYVRRLTANLGGTELTAPLTLIGRMECPPGFRRVILLFTDGAVSSVDAVARKAAELYERQKQRIFTFGIGSGVSTALVQRVAAVTNASTEYCVDGEPMEGSCMRQMQRALQPVLHNVRVDWGALQDHVMLQVPADGIAVAALAPGETLVVKALLRPSALDVAEATATWTGTSSHNGAVVSVAAVPIKLSAPSGSAGNDGVLTSHNSAVRHAVAAGRIAELEQSMATASSADARAALRAETVAVALAHGVACSVTSFVAVDDALPAAAADAPAAGDGDNNNGNNNANMTVGQLPDNFFPEQLRALSLSSASDLSSDEEDEDDADADDAVPDFLALNTRNEVASARLDTRAAAPPPPAPSALGVQLEGSRAVPSLPMAASSLPMAASSLPMADRSRAMPREKKHKKRSKGKPAEMTAAKTSLALARRASASRSRRSAGAGAGAGAGGGGGAGAGGGGGFRGPSLGVSLRAAKPSAASSPASSADAALFASLAQLQDAAGPWPASSSAAVLALLKCDLAAGGAPPAGVDAAAWLTAIVCAFVTGRLHADVVVVASLVLRKAKKWLAKHLPAGMSADQLATAATQWVDKALPRK